VSAALVFAEVVRDCFDLYRHDLIKQPGYTIQALLEDERRLWHNLGAAAHPARRGRRARPAVCDRPTAPAPRRARSR